MIQEVQKKIKELNMVSPQDTLLVGVSGGADSVCLLLILEHLSKNMQFRVEAVHVEHGIRGNESLEDAAFVEDLCRHLQLPLHQVSVDVPAYSKAMGMGLEEAARHLRYEAFVKLAKERNAKIALAHHMEDNAETVLFQMLRGSSLTGLCGMQPIRVDEHGITYLRPLLSIHRKQIEDFLESSEIAYRVDSTNAQLDYSRNYIRGVILPELNNINQQAVAHINATASQLTEVRDFLEAESKKAWEQVVCEHREEENHVPAQKLRLILDATELAKLHIAMQKELAYKAIAYMLGAKKDIIAIHVQDLLDLCSSQSGKALHLPNGLQAKREYNQIKLFYSHNIHDISAENGEANSIWISREQLLDCKNEAKTFELALNTAGEHIHIRIFPFHGENAKIPQKTYTKWFDYDKIKDGFCIRTRRSGDAFIGDTFGHRKKLKQYFIDEKIPASEREGRWLLAQESTVLWLIGGRISEHIKVTEATNTIIEITYDGGK